MVLTKKITSEVQVDYELPAYFKNNHSYTAVFSENHAVQLCFYEGTDYMFYTWDGRKYIETALHDAVEIKKAEFEEAYNAYKTWVLSKAQRHIEKLNQSLASNK